MICDRAAFERARNLQAVVLDETGTLTQGRFGVSDIVLLWVTGYNAIAIPLAAGVAVAWGSLLTPAVCAVLMSVSTVIVAINAQLLGRQHN